MLCASESDASWSGKTGRLVEFPEVMGELFLRHTFEVQYKRQKLVLAKDCKTIVRVNDHFGIFLAQHASAAAF